MIKENKPLNKKSSVLESVHMMNKNMFEIKNFYYEHINKLKTEALSKEIASQIEGDKMRIMKLEKRWERLLQQKTTRLSFEDVNLLSGELCRLYNNLSSFSISQNNNGISIFNN